MAPVRVACVFRLPIIVAMAALALSGCVHTTAPVAMAQPQSDLDSFAYGESYRTAPAGAVSSRSDVTDSGGAVSALRNAFAAAPQYAYAPGQVAYAAAPMPVAYEAAYRLDAGDRMRVVVYGQEGLTNSYAIDAGGSITMPLIGAVPARGRTPAGLAAVLYPGRSRGARPIPLRSQHERRERGSNRRRLLPARPPRQRHADPRRQVGPDADRGAARDGHQSRRYGSGRRTLVLKLRHSRACVSTNPESRR
jgi:hypothetical protein